MSTPHLTLIITDPQPCPHSCPELEQVGQMWFVTCPSCHSVIETGCQVYTKTSA
ncbi:hypothetical protein [Mycolicibacterium peregrinum]|uniref:hypothetical protein n=1 Tax=Mycolicibacterium peregrinum TaxID=43304 RepID=UPI003AAD2A57